MTVSRRDFMKGAAAAGAVGAIAPALVASDAHATGAPNIVIICSDDQRADELWPMAKMQTRLVSQGTTFSNFFVSRPVCQPSRASFLTGQFPHNHKVGNNADAAGDTLMSSTNLLPTWLRNAGYYTVAIGKLLNSFDDNDPVPPGWDDWQVAADAGNHINWYLNDNGTIVNGTRYLEDEYAARAETVIDEWRALASPKPLFMWVGPSNPHAGSNATPARYRNDFKTWEPLWLPSFNEADVSDKPGAIRRLLPFDSTVVNRIRTSERVRLRQLKANDDLVDRILTALGADLANTIVIYTSDNGFMRGEHRIAGEKSVPYEESVKVPFVMMGPGIPVNHTVDRVASGTDLCKTIADLAGATTGRAQDGVSLLEYLADPLAHQTRAVLISGGTYVAVRTKRYKYVRHGNGERELYDLLNDPYEMASKHTDPAYAAVRTHLDTLSTQLKTCAGASCKKVYDTVPVAAFTVSKSLLQVSVNAAGSSDVDGAVTGYAWSFGDGATATGVTAQHTYAAGGTYTITLTVTDNSGRTAQKSTSVTVNAAPLAAFTHDANGLVVDFDATGSSDPDGTITAYAWAFGDGTTGTGATPQHTYVTSGSYSVTLTVTDSSGNTDTETKTIAVSRVPVAAFTHDADGLVVDFDATGSSDPDGSIASYAWDFGDGTSGSGATPQHTYATSGDYDVALTVTDGTGNTAGVTHSVHVNAGPNAAFGHTEDGLTVDVDASSSADPNGTISSYAWDFGDGATATGTTAQHTYAAGGTYTITLTVTDDEGATDTASDGITVTE